MTCPTKQMQERYGPVKDSEDTQYRVTSKLSVTDKGIYTIADGEVIVTNAHNADGTANADHVNVLFRPFFNYDLFPGMPKVKYFVYRGIKKASYFDTGSGDVKTTDENAILKSLNAGASGTGSSSDATRRQKFKD